MTPFYLMDSINFSRLKSSTIVDIPEEWIYKYYLNLPFDLTGRAVRIKSQFQSENTASMFLYVKDNRYVWKDHSSGYYGNALDLTKRLFEQSSGTAISWETTYKTLRADFEAWKAKGNTIEQTTKNTEYFAYDLVCNVERRRFEDHDVKYWDRFGISISLLERYNIIPLKSFRLGKYFKESGLTKWFKKIDNDWFSYGFYENSGTLVKIYNPHNTDFKHVTLKSTLLGREQLQNRDTLVIASSMKDLLTLVALGLEIDVAAPMSEKSLIKAQDIQDLKNIYTNILTMFDNDKTGVMAMLMYKSIYNIDFAYLPYNKDVSEFREFQDPLFVKHEIIQAINKKIFKGIFKNEAS